MVLSSAWESAAMDGAVPAVQGLLRFVGLLKTGERLDDVDAVIGIAETAVSGMSALRERVEKVQTNVMTLEERVKNEVMPMKDEIIKINARVAVGEGAVHNVLQWVSTWMCGLRSLICLSTTSRVVRVQVTLLAQDTEETEAS